MSLPKSCKKCSHYDSLYGCSLLYECETYQDIMADAKYEAWIELPETKEYFNKLDQNK